VETIAFCLPICVSVSELTVGGAVGLVRHYCTVTIIGVTAPLLGSVVTSPMCSMSRREHGPPKYGAKGNRRQRLSGACAGIRGLLMNRRVCSYSGLVNKQ